MGVGWRWTKGVRTRTRLRRWIGLSCLALAGLTATLFWLINRPRDSFQFLDGHPMTTSGISWMHRDAYEYRVYSWIGNFSDVRTHAIRELAALGFREVYSEKTSSILKAPGGQIVVVSNDRTEENPDCRPPYRDSNWVTVCVGESLPDSWVTHMRYGLTHCSDP